MRRRRYNDLRVSIESHLEEKIEDLMEGGMTRAEAERTARREFGNEALIEERSREVWRWPRFESILADVRFAFRQLRSAPGFTTTAVTTLALGIAVNATMFSLVSAFLMPRLPGKDPKQVMVISSVNPNQGDFADVNPVSAPNYLAWRNESRIFSQVAAADDNRSGSLTWEGQPEAIYYAAISTNYFDVFGSAPVLGRAFLPGEDTPGRDHVAILSRGLWERRFASDPSIIGRVIRLNREDYTVVGVMEKSFRLLEFNPQLWTPLVLNAADQTSAARKNRFLYLFGRLAPGIMLEQARAELSVVAARTATEYADVEKRWGASIRTLPDYVSYAFGIRTGLAVLMTTVGFILLIACANVAGLFLTRAVGRQKEMAIRVSLGAGRTRIIRQLMTEGLVIALLGGAAGLLLAYFGIQIMRANLMFNEVMASAPISLDRNVLWFVAAIALVSAALSSVVPAIKMSLGDVNADLKSESRGASASRSKTHLRSVLVTAEVAMALFLLTGSCLLIHSVYLFDHQKLGFNTERLLTASVTLDRARYENASQQLLFTRRLLASLRQILGVEHAAVASNLPATGAAKVAVRIQGWIENSPNAHMSALDVVATPDYFRAAEIPLLRGRTFTEMDDIQRPPVVLVNQEFASRYFKDQNPLGKQIQMEVNGAMSRWSEIVGVVSDAKGYSQDTLFDPQIYEAFYQRPVGSYSLMLRSNIEPEKLAVALYQAVTQLDKELPLARVMSMDTLIDLQRNGNPFFTRVLGIFALLALSLAAIGLYGLIAYSVTQRTQEIGVRMALGAEGSDIRRMILRSGFTTTAMGSAVGLAMALPLPKLFDSIFTGLHTGAPSLYFIVLAAMLMVAAVAICIPALRAGRISPIAVLRIQ